MKQAGAAVLLCGALTACVHAGGSSFTPGNAPVSLRHTTSPNGYKQLFVFDGADGADPFASLLESRGLLYGTASAGGNYSVFGGTAFSLTPTGKESILHYFGPAGDGRNPQSGVTLYNGTFYGTTEYGGKFDDGVVYSFTPSGTERVLHTFGRVPDGKNPIGGLAVLNGMLYGTTSGGGRHNGGVVFRITPGGNERVIYNFGRTEGDGSDPEAGLVVVKGTLYGTTFRGGCSGTAFSITASGHERVLHRFACGSYGDGADPSGGLVADGDTLYGVTLGGGGGKQSQIDGTVYSVTTGGKEQVLHSFGAGDDGRYPRGSLVLVNNALYGVTSEGGKNGYGAVFSIAKSGSERILHSFGAPPDGSDPEAGLTRVKDTLYGTTSSGGGGYHARGTIFQISP